ncbi:MAG: hypothetical protein LAT64_04385 [Phycisphaerales bacterium]|nr:hypothetical protein [Planctomycetota bacterium]MCH8507991.1 hypothetical protein [Phycisphaerales bacterium]
MGAFRLVSVIAAAGMLGLPGLTGCTSYTNVPGPDAAIAMQDPNARQASRAVQAALEWTVRRHPVDGPFLINLPVGTSTETATTIAESLGPMARVPDSQSTDLPVYHIPRVWIRMSDGKVDVVYPTKDGLGREIDRGVTVWMNAGVRPWRVSRGQYWSPGTVPVPEIWVPIPAEELRAQAEAERAAAREARQAAATERRARPEPAEPAPERDEPEPRPAPEPVPPPADDPGTVYREVPPGGGD